MGLIEDVCRCVEQLIRSGYLAEAICEDLALIVRAARSGTALAIIAPMACPWMALSHSGGGCGCGKSARNRFWSSCHSS